MLEPLGLHKSPSNKCPVCGRQGRLSARTGQTCTRHHPQILPCADGGTSSPSKEQLASQSSAQGHSSDGRVLVDGKGTGLLSIERVGADRPSRTLWGIVDAANQLCEKTNPVMTGMTVLNFAPTKTDTFWRLGYSDLTRTGVNKSLWHCHQLNKKTEPVLHTILC
jgi:hypothetical protein